MDSSPRSRYLRKRYLVALLASLILLFVVTNFHDVKHYAKTAAPALLSYAEQANPWVTGLVLGAVAALDSSFLPIPEGNDFLIVLFAIRNPYMSVWFIVTSALGSLLGSLFIFSMGRQGGAALLRKRFSTESADRIQKWFDRYGIWAILLPCIMPPPMPFKLFVLSAGVLRFGYLRFSIATVCGRLVRYGIWAILAILFREQIQYFMKHHLLELGIGVLAFLVLLGVGAWGWARFSRRGKILEGVDPVVDVPAESVR